MPLYLMQHASDLDGDLETPVSLFIREVGEQQGILLESAAVDGYWGRYSIIAHNFLLTATCCNGLLVLQTADSKLAPLHSHNGKPYFQGVRDLMHDLVVHSPEHLDLPPITRGLHGYIGYEATSLLVPELQEFIPPHEAEACLVLPGRLTLFDHGYNRLIRLDVQKNGKSLTPLPPTTIMHEQTAPNRPALANREAFITAVQRTQQRIAKGEASQVVLSTPFSAPLAESPFSLYRRLRRVNPSPYMFYMRLPNGVLLGSSPEVLVTSEKGTLRLCPIAGTRPRGGSKEQDLALEHDLLHDHKERVEHTMLVELARKDLERIAAPGSVALQRFMSVERFSHVMHLTSYFKAELSHEKDAIDILSATFPAGTVSGAPRTKAMEIIAFEEQALRGPYAGAIGWLGLDKDAVDLDFGITIRSLWVRHGRVIWQAGAGIVSDSNPEKEWEECLAKSAAIRKVIFGSEPEKTQS